MRAVVSHNCRLIPVAPPAISAPPFIPYTQENGRGHTDSRHRLQSFATRCSDFRLAAFMQKPFLDCRSSLRDRSRAHLQPVSVNHPPGSIRGGRARADGQVPGGLAAGAASSGRRAASCASALSAARVKSRSGPRPRSPRTISGTRPRPATCPRLREEARERNARATSDSMSPGIECIFQFQICKSTERHVSYHVSIRVPGSAESGISNCIRPVMANCPGFRGSHARNATREIPLDCSMWACARLPCVPLLRPVPGI